ncbi:hypothetical protein PVAP13_1NG403900 [Panicum virgatum]|uniref:Uncharacterized protein n=1 Tax=Panicum virgatum TaxID=38727 RepID=A0A8T0X8L7_PANVG|nr:hypothetical protein PVAP13_1NG403900 [Panicum virgatum]
MEARTRGTLCLSSRCLASSQYMRPTSWISTHGAGGPWPPARRTAKKALLWQRTSLCTPILTAIPSFPYSITVRSLVSGRSNPTQILCCGSCCPPAGAGASAAGWSCRRGSSAGAGGSSVTDGAVWTDGALD